MKAKVLGIDAPLFRPVQVCGRLLEVRTASIQQVNLESIFRHMYSCVVFLIAGFENLSHEWQRVEFFLDLILTNR